VRFRSVFFRCQHTWCRKKPWSVPPPSPTSYQTNSIVWAPPECVPHKASSCAPSVWSPRSRTFWLWVSFRYSSSCTRVFCIDYLVTSPHGCFTRLTRWCLSRFYYPSPLLSSISNLSPNLCRLTLPSHAGCLGKCKTILDEYSYEVIAYFFKLQ